jgi:hypothetical protein
MRRWRAALWGLGLGSMAVASGATSQPAPAQPRYARAIEEALSQLDLDVRCANEGAQRQHCRATRKAEAGDGAILHSEYSDDSDTIYLYLEQYLVVPSDSPRSAALLRRLMELNWELLIGKFEWNARTGEVRLAAVVNSDSNFDRRAFRSTVRALYTVGARYRAELQGLTGP